MLMQMTTPSYSRHPLIGLIDEVVRTGARLRSVFAATRRQTGLGESEFTVLNAVVEAVRAPTVAQIGRSLGRPRQLVQRAANSLVESGLIETAYNPDHKRAPLLIPTDQGIALKRAADTRGDEIAARLGEGLDLTQIEAVTERLGAVRKELEARLRQEGL